MLQALVFASFGSHGCFSDLLFTIWHLQILPTLKLRMIDFSCYISNLWFGDLAPSAFTDAQATDDTSLVATSTIYDF